MLGNIGVGELTVILVIVLVLFGAKRLPDLAQSLGKSFTIFKKSLKEGAEEESEKKPAEKIR